MFSLTWDLKEEKLASWWCGGAVYQESRIAHANAEVDSLHQTLGTQWRLLGVLGQSKSEEDPYDMRLDDKHASSQVFREVDTKVQWKVLKMCWGNMNNVLRKHKR